MRAVSPRKAPSCAPASTRSTRPCTRGYGLGIYVRYGEDGSYRISHGGDFGGYRSAAIHDSRTGLTLAVQGNDKEFEAPDFAFALFEGLTAD